MSIKDQGFLVSQEDDTPVLCCFQISQPLFRRGKLISSATLIFHYHHSPFRSKGNSHLTRLLPLSQCCTHLHHRPHSRACAKVFHLRLFSCSKSASSNSLSICIKVNPLLLTIGLVALPACVLCEKQKTQICFEDNQKSIS